MRTQLAGLPDAERRAVAADMALQLAALMGDSDDEDGDVSDSEDDVFNGTTRVDDAHPGRGGSAAVPAMVRGGI